MNIFRSNKLQLESLEATISQHETLIAELTNEKIALIDANKSLTEQLAELKTDHEVLEVQTEEVTEQLTEVVEEVKELVESAVSIEAVASLKAIEVLNTLGVAPIDVIEDEAQEAIDNNRPSVADQLKSLTGKELNEFFNANKAEIYKLIKGR